MKDSGRHPQQPPGKPEPHGPEPIIRTEHLTLHYENKPALKDITLAIPPRRVTALIGPSGSGKTSFLTCLNRLTDLIPNCRLSGRAWIGREEISDPKTDVIALRRRVGMIFQKPNPFPLSIGKNLSFPLREHGIRDARRIEEIIETTLRDVGLWEEVKDRLTAPALSLSGGQQQRLCIARALALRPEVLLMDEPCSALDVLSSGVVENLITRLKDRYTLVVVTHNLPQARRIADHAALFWAAEGTGRLIEYGTAHEVFKDPREALTAAYVSGAQG